MISPEKELLIKFYFLAVISIAFVPAIYSFMMPSSFGLSVASAQFVEAIPVDGWVWALSTDSSSTPSLTTDSSGTLKFISGGNPSGLGWAALWRTTSTPRFVMPGVTQSSQYDYGLTFYLTDAQTRQGYFEGHVWSSAFGWMEFSNTATGCPRTPCSATVDAAGNVHGWARILSLPQAGSNSGGFDGWIKLGNESGDPIPYGLRVEANGAFGGYAWSNEFGWFKFIGQVGNPPVDVCPNIGGVQTSPPPGMVINEFGNCVVPGTASCNIDASPRNVRIPRSTATASSTATTTVAWGCLLVKDSPPCIFTEATASSTNSFASPSSSPIWGIVKTLSKTTDYIISCTSAIDSSQVSAHQAVTAQYPTQIIECNPNSADCK